MKWAQFLRWLHLGIYNRLFTMFPSFTVRHFLLRRLYGMEIGYHTNIEMGVRFFAPQRITIGDNSIVHFDSILDGRSQLHIGRCVDIGHQAHIFTLQHDIDSPSYNTKGGAVVIEDYVIVGGRSTILPGVTLSEGSVIASGSVVTNDVAPYTLVGGVPAKYIRDRNQNLEYRLSYRRYFH